MRNFPNVKTDKVSTVSGGQKQVLVILETRRDIVDVVQIRPRTIRERPGAFDLPDLTTRSLNPCTTSTAIHLCFLVMTMRSPSPGRKVEDPGGVGTQGQWSAIVDTRAPVYPIPVF